MSGQEITYDEMVAVATASYLSTVAREGAVLKLVADALVEHGEVQIGQTAMVILTEVLSGMSAEELGAAVSDEIGAPVRMTFDGGNLVAIEVLP